ncbi:MAG: hypothetical protein H7X95_10885 [Deltaproteobacteria bacterium]|nr:hypothetical protein [Deltaproteobacteria bacterium]
MAYAATYRFNLYSNFTLYLRDPDNGDEIAQVDRRAFYGGKVSYRVIHHLGPVTLDSTIGGDGRSDDIHGELWETLQRRPLRPVRSHNVEQTLVGAYVNEEIRPARWIRAAVGGRVDLLSFVVDNQLANSDPTVSPTGTGTGSGAAHQISPKANLTVTPLDRPSAHLDLFVNYGHGFHSNDVRGAFAQPAVTPLTRAIGKEVGARTRILGRWDLAAALWQLDLDNETVWSGDEGTTAVSAATHRQGIELDTRFEVAPWLAADLEVTFTQSKFRDTSRNSPLNGGGLALAPRQTWAGGLSGRHPIGSGLARGGLRFYGIGDRPATDDGALIAPGFTQVDLHLGLRYRRFDVALDIENLFNGRFRAAQFATISRLHGEPSMGAPVPAGFGCGKNARLANAPDGTPANGTFQGCEDISFTPAYPLTVRLMATLYLDW